MLLIGRKSFRKNLRTPRNSNNNKMKQRDSGSRGLQSKRPRSLDCKDCSLRRLRDSDYSDYRSRRQRD